MTSAMRRDELDVLLDELCELTPDHQRAAALELTRRLRVDRLRILVVGEAKRGKSTLINALLARPVLPMGVTPLTSIATTLVHGTPERVEVQFHDGRHERYPLNTLEDLVTETGNPHNRRHVESVIAYVGAPLLTWGVELVDTPGTGSVYAHNTHAAQQALAMMDAAVFVLSADTPISQAELDLLAQVDAASVATFVVLNKADRLDTAECDQACAFAADVAGRRLGRTVTVYPCSARTALTGGFDSGLATFTVDLSDYLRRERADGLESSLARQAGALAGQLRDQVRVTLRADELRAGADRARVDEFRSRLNTLDVRRRDAQDAARAQFGHLLEDLSDDAGRAIEQSAGVVRAHLEGWLADHSADLRTREVYERGRDQIAQAATAQAEDWRAPRAQVLAQEVDTLGMGLTDGVDRDLTAVCDAAKGLLGIDLSAPAAGFQLAVDPRFHYAPPAPDGPTEVVAAAVRGAIPGRYARRRAHQDLRALVDEMVDRQLGRARADLQYRLAQTLRSLTGAVAERYDQYGVHLAGALRVAEGLQALTSAQADEQRALLAEREQNISTLIIRLTVLPSLFATPLIREATSQP